MKRRRAVPPLQVLCAGTALWLWPGLAEAWQIRELPSMESIASYDVAIDVQETGWLEVTETIRVRALGEEVRWGIDRDLPIGPRREHGLGRVTAPFEVMEVHRDGAPYPYVIHDVGGFAGSSGVRVRMGNPEDRLSPGEHVYSLTYRTTRWLEFDGDRVRLHWDVTGHRWPLPIISASARIHLPGRVAEDAVSLGGWTGRNGSREENLVTSFEPATDSGSVAAFRTTKPLRRAEGLAIDLAFPAALVSRPTTEQQAEWSRLDRKPYADMVPILFLVFGFYLVGWAVVGRDPPGRPVVVRYDVPEGLSPAAVGYLDARGYDARQLTATMMSLARQGVLEIEVKGRKWTIRRTGPITETLTPDERGVVEKLLPDRDALVILGISHRRLGEAKRALHTELKRRFRTRYFVTNRGWTLLGGLLSLVGIAALATRARFGLESSIWTLSLSLFFGSIIAARLLTRGFRRWRTDLAEM